MSENKAKSGTPAPGAGATAQTGAKDPAVDQTGSTSAAKGVILVSKEPEWVQKIVDAIQDLRADIQVIVLSKDELLEASQATVSVCEGTIKAVKTFDERAKDVVQEIMKEAKGVAGANAPVVETPKVELNPDAKYRVAKGQSFQDKNDPERVYKAGNDVSKLDPERLENLLAQGIIEEA